MPQIIFDIFRQHAGTVTHASFTQIMEWFQLIRDNEQVKEVLAATFSSYGLKVIVSWVILAAFINLFIEALDWFFNLKVVKIPVKLAIRLIWGVLYTGVAVSNNIKSHIPYWWPSSNKKVDTKALVKSLEVEVKKGSKKRRGSRK